MKKDVFKNNWIHDVTQSLVKMYPDVNIEDIKDYVLDLYVKNIKNNSCELHNNYVNKAYSSNLLSIIDWIEDKKPICAGYGVFYLNQDLKDNLDANMLNTFMTTRATVKKKLKTLNPSSYEYYYTDSQQLSEKRKANSFYGTNLSSVSVFYNKYTGVSITATGQSLLSTTETSFEAFVASRFKFYGLDDLFNYMNLCLEDTDKILKYDLEDVSLNQLYEWLLPKMDSDKELLYRAISNLNQKEINRLYYANNIFEVIRQGKIFDMLVQLVNKIDFYRDASKIPEGCQSLLNELWYAIRDIVYVRIFYFDRIHRFKNDKRGAVILCDTDSDMICIDPWVTWIRNNVISKARKPDDLNTRFIAVSIKAYLMTEMITDTLEHYCKKANVLERYIPKINMKNEFLMATMALAATKKRYISIQLLREGREFNPPKYDAKGIDFLKGNTREATREFFDKLSQDYILNAEEICISDILNELDRFQNIMKESLSQGRKDFTIPASVKEPEGYKNPLSNMNLLAVIAWNNFYPNDMIALPEIVDVVKVTLNTDKSLELLKEKYPDKYEVIISKYLNDKTMQNKLPNAIAIPKSIEEIPEWIIDFINYDVIISDNINKFNSVRESLGIAQSKMKGNRTTYSNILEI